MRESDIRRARNGLPTPAGRAADRHPPITTSRPDAVPWCDFTDLPAESCQHCKEIRMSTPDLSEWAADMAADDLEPGNDAITVDGDGKPIVRILLAFRSDMDARTRSSFVLALGEAIADAF